MEPDSRPWTRFVYSLQLSLYNVLNSEIHPSLIYPLSFGTITTDLQNIFSQIREVAKEEGIFAKDEFRTMLQFYHDLGVIVYYGGLGALDNTLRNTVILKPQWLVDMFKRIITVRDLEQQVKCSITGCANPLRVYN